MAYFQKRSGAWRAIVKKKGHERQTRTFDTKAEAEAWARALETEMDRGVFVSRKEAESTTLSEALDRYKKEVADLKKGAYQESRRIEYLKNHKLSKRFLASILGKDIAEYRDDRKKTVSEATVRRELTVLSHLFEVAKKEWGMESLSNPVKAIRLPSARGEVRERRLSQKEEAAILAGCKEYGGDVHDVVVLAIETGMRRGELIGMTWDQVDLNKRTVTLPETKNGEKRVVPLSTTAIQTLKEMPRRIDGKVFGFEDPHSITTAFLRVLKRSRETYVKDFGEMHKGKKDAKPDSTFLVDLTFHDLRHEATSRFFEKGLNPMQVAAITGHKTLQMLKRYTHLKAEDLAELLK